MRRLLNPGLVLIGLFVVLSPALLVAQQDGGGELTNRFREERLRREGHGTQSENASSLQPKMSSENDGDIDIIACLTSPVADVDVPAKTGGPLLSVDVTEMQAVQTGQALGQIDPELAQLQLDSAKVKLEAAKARASDDVGVRYAQAAAAVAQKEKETNQQLARKGSLPVREYERSKLAAKQADLQIEKSIHDLDVARKEARVEEYNVNAAESSLKRHAIVSPLGGNVVQIFKEKGEWTQEGEKVFRIIQMDRMRVEGLLELSKYRPQDVAGKPVTVTLFTAGKEIEFKGRVVMIDLESNGGKRLTVRAEIENRLEQGRWLLPAGAEVDMKIHVNQPMASNDGSFQSRR